MTAPKVQAGGIIRTALDNTWQTPEYVLDRVRAYFLGLIPFDPATTPCNPAGAIRFCAGPPGTMFADQLGGNGLEAEWPAEGTFCNPPYGGELKDWLGKFADEAEKGCEIVALLPASRWEMGYLHRALRAANLVCFPRGRISFISSIDGKAVGGNPGASMLLGLNVHPDRFVVAFSPLGLCLDISEAT